MKLFQKLPRRRAEGFTLVEAYSSTVILLLLVLALTACQLFALKLYQLSATKLTATAGARKAMNFIREQVRGCSYVEVGIFTPTNNTFTLIGIGTNQIGNALAIYSNNPTVNSLAKMYYMNPSGSNLCGAYISNYVLLPGTVVTNVINYITNYYVFDAEDCSNNVAVTWDNNRVIHVKVQFSQWEFPLAGVVGQNAMYDYYQLQTKATRRVMDY